ncbi:MAG: hypothetical protein NZ523_06325 [Elioraea sp.]|nr:hypothetical protein [Elioraea sp.]
MGERLRFYHAGYVPDATVEGVTLFSEEISTGEPVVAELDLTIHR